MSSSSTICPYTGLRSFTEDESIYFKGRDPQIDQLSSLLEKNKFLMVTGASGEGKSSLIYAGLVPNARAGFFKAKFSNWVVADFRPERNPVGNMATALADKLGYPKSTVTTELQRGFSSLIDLYTNSPFYIADEELKDATIIRKREAANLMILVDQFEEFFTNPENFFNEVPSQDSQIVVNLLLETARIALSKNIPIYIVCTMRSDYIGQCSAFRGLPEYIGFSQFFVPRLKRKDLKQVIEEPAILSGNRITQRLIERVVYDLSDGIDQLPILQHAMSQIWLAAAGEEMDLIHYAMVGGMAVEELPDADHKQFNTWLQKQPEFRKRYHTQPGLQKVIEIHASVLYEQAWERSRLESTNSDLSNQEAKRIVAITFACLTKIDNSRAVRNRMTLREITEIVNQPGITTKEVGSVINIYREDGNSFIRPFKTDGPTSHELTPDTVLDITHESLIRNWNKLNEWAATEFDFYSTYLDLKKQLDRWIASGKSSSYLLPIGPLSYFENWYQECKPNAGWIKRYTEVAPKAEASNQTASKILTDIQGFLKRSARMVMVTRAFMKYGPQRIASVFAIIIMMALSAFYWYDAEQKQNDKVVEKVRGELAVLVKSEEVGTQFKAFHILVSERLEPGFIQNYFTNLAGEERISQATETYKQLLEINKKDKSATKAALVDIILREFEAQNLNVSNASFLLGEVNKLITQLAYDEYYNPSPQAQANLVRATQIGYSLVAEILKDKASYQVSLGTEMNYAIQNWLTFGEVDANKIQALLNILSPIGGGKEIFQIYYPKGSYEINGRVPNDYNGGYHTVASLYAALGEVDNIVWCFDQMRSTGQDEYFIGSLFNNYNHVLGILYQFGYGEKRKSMIDWLAANYESDTPLTVHRNSFIRAGYISHLYIINIEKNSLRSYKGYFYPNLCLADRAVFEGLAAGYEQEILKVADVNERNYLLALNYKRKAMFEDKYNFDREIKSDTTKLNKLLALSIEHYRRIDPQYLQETVPVTLPYYRDGVRNREIKRKHMLLYPDYMDGWFSNTYHTDLFFQYLHTNNLIEQLFTETEDLDLLHLWLAKAYEVQPFAQDITFDNDYSITVQILMSILSVVDTHAKGKDFDRNLIYLLLANKAFSLGDQETGFKYHALFDQSSISRSSDRYEYLEKTFFFNQMKDLCMQLAGVGAYTQAEQLAENFEVEHEKVFAYLFMADQIFQNGDPMAFVYLDSAFKKAEAVDINQFNFGAFQSLDFRYNMLYILGRIGGKQVNQKMMDTYREFLEGAKPYALFFMMLGIGDEGNLYRAYASIPSTLTESEDVMTRFAILLQAARKRENLTRNEWSPMDRFFIQDLYYVFYKPV